MSASTSDKITDVRNAARPNSARATGTRSAGGNSLACDNLAGWPTASKVHFVTYRIDSDSNPVAGTQLDCSGIVSSNTIGSFTVIDGTDLGNSVNDVVEMLPTAAWGQDLADALSNQHSRTGAHVGITNIGGMTTDTLVVTSGTSLPAGDIGTADLAAASVTADKLATGATSAAVTASEGTASASFSDLATVTDTVTVTVGANGLLWVSLSALFSSGSGGFSGMSFALSGANTQAAANQYSLAIAITARLSGSFLVTGLAPGSTTVKAKYNSSSGTGTFADRRISAMPV